jgi:CheY-like chemotaxis protein
MVYGFARQSGGHVSVTSVEWGGTVVKLFLPVAPEAAMSETEQDPTGVAAEGGSETVFVLEDDADVRAFVAASLSAKGYSVVTAGDGVAAIDQLNNGLEFDLLLSDVVLPRGVTGPEFARHMHGRHPDIPVLFMSGYTDDALEGADLPEIGYDLIQKPFSRETLYARVRESLDRVSA